MASMREHIVVFEFRVFVRKQAQHAHNFSLKLSDVFNRSQGIVERDVVMDRLDVCFSL